jgi:hypothetical protein
MAKRTNRVAWGLAGGLAVGLLGGCRTAKPGYGGSAYLGRPPGAHLDVDIYGDPRYGGTTPQVVSLAELQRKVDYPVPQVPVLGSPNRVDYWPTMPYLARLVWFKPEGEVWLLIHRIQNNAIRRMMKSRMKVPPNTLYTTTFRCGGTTCGYYAGGVMGDGPSADLISPDEKLKLTFLSKRLSLDHAKSWCNSYLTTVAQQKKKIVPPRHDSSAGRTTREPVRITHKGSRPIVTLSPTLHQAIRRHFPGYNLPPLTVLVPDLRKVNRSASGKPAVSFVCSGDFDGNGLPDVAVFLKGRQNHLMLVAFHQTHRGRFRLYQLGRRKPDRGLFAYTITSRASRRLDPVSSQERPVQAKHDWIEEEDWWGTSNTGHYFESGRYRSIGVMVAE